MLFVLFNLCPIIDEEIAFLPINFSPPTSQQAKITDIKTVPDNAKTTEDFTINAESDENLIVNDVENTTEERFTIDFAEQYPELRGGDENYIKLIRFLQENLTYPKSARDVGLEGQVYVGFTVEKSGRLTNFVVLRGAAPIFDNEVIRVLKLVPNLEPKKNNGKYVAAHFQIPVTFSLR